MSEDRAFFDNLVEQPIQPVPDYPPLIAPNVVVNSSDGMTQVPRWPECEMEHHYPGSFTPEGHVHYMAPGSVTVIDSDNRTTTDLSCRVVARIEQLARILSATPIRADKWNKTKEEYERFISDHHWGRETLRDEISMRKYKTLSLGIAKPVVFSPRGQIFEQCSGNGTSDPHRFRKDDWCMWDTGDAVLCRVCRNEVLSRRELLLHM